MAWLRVAQTLGAPFDVTSVAFRDADKAASFRKSSGVKAVLGIKETLTDNPDFIVIAVHRDAQAEIILSLLPHGVPLLIETPPAENLETLLKIWNAARDSGARVQVAEQYFLHPLHQAMLRIAERGTLGNVHSVNISRAHDYHAVSLIRKFLACGFADVKIQGQSYSFPIVATDSRQGIRTDGEMIQAVRARLALEFTTGQTAFYDFAPDVQYRTKIRAMHLSVQGPRGEIDDSTLRALTPENLPFIATFRATENINTGTTHSISLGPECLWVNQYANTRLTDDETAMAACLAGMDEYIRTGKEFYPLSEGCQDAYFFFLMREALKNPGTIVLSTSQIWHH